MIVGFVLIHIPEQGCRNDLLQRAVGGVPQDRGSPSTKIRSLYPNPISSQNIKSDIVHYDPSTQLIVLSGSSCHTADILKERMDKEQKSPFPPYNFSRPPPPWVHVFSKSRANSSLRTQCAAVATGEVLSPTVFHCQLHRARKKQCKQDRLLQEIIVPSTPVKISTTQIHSDIIVFDGGGDSTPPIQPPDGVAWRSILSVTFILKTRLGATLGLPFL
jgi:hypothetical protein